MEENLYQKSIEYHKKYKGKIGISLNMPLENREDLSLAYSPGVGAVSLEIKDNPESANTLTLKGHTVLIVSDGSAILGLGNLGAKSAIPVMEGKAALLKYFADVDAFPICLMTQDKDEIVEIIKNIAPVFGAINLEDISAPRCFYIEERLRKELDIPVMHDDQWGTATVVLAGLLNALKIKNQKIEESKIIISGVGSAGVALARLLFKIGASNILFVDSHGIINNKRENLSKEKEELLAKSTAYFLDGDLKDAVLGRDIFIGLSKPNILSKEMVSSMNKDSIIFALANPVPEIMPDLAYEGGAFVVATGRSDFPNQVNNALVFPGILKASLEVKGAQFSDNVFIEVAKRLASLVLDPNKTEIIPSIFDKRVVKTVFDTAKEVFESQIKG